jgi:hypothetical protein
MSTIPGRAIGLGDQYLEYVVAGATAVLASAIILYHTRTRLTTWTPSDFPWMYSCFLILSLLSIVTTYRRGDLVPWKHWLVSILLKVNWLYVLFVWNWGPTLIS